MSTIKITWADTRAAQRRRPGSPVCPASSSSLLFYPHTLSLSLFPSLFRAFSSLVSPAPLNAVGQARSLSFLRTPPEPISVFARHRRVARVPRDIPLSPPSSLPVSLCAPHYLQFARYRARARVHRERASSLAQTPDRRTGCFRFGIDSPCFPSILTERHNPIL